MASDPALLDYIRQCFDQGFTVPEVRQVLVEAGWQAEAIEEGLNEASTVSGVGAALSSFIEEPTSPVIKPEAAHVTEPTSHPIASHSGPPLDSDAPVGTIVASRKVPSWGIILGSVLGIIIVATSTAIAFAEQGYLPGFSKVYRKTPLPLLWHGTTGNPELSLLKTVQAQSKVTAYQYTFTSNLTIDKKDATQPVSLQKWPLIAGLFTHAPAHQYADIAPGSVILTPSASTDPMTSLYGNPDQFLPFKLGLSGQSDLDPQLNAHIKLDFDISNFVNKLQAFKTELPGLKNDVTVEGTLSTKDSAAYARSSLIPYLTTGDQDKWLKFVLQPEDLKSYTDEINGKNAETNFDKKDFVVYKAILDASMKDNGVVRKNGAPYASYTFTLNKAIFSTLANRSDLKDYKSTLSDFANSGTTAVITIWVDPRTSLLAFIQGSFDVVPDGMNLAIHYDYQQAATYGTAAITSPDSKQVINDGADYLTQIGDKLMGSDLSDSSTTSDLFGGTSAELKTKNYTRQSDVTEIAKAIEVYRNEDENNNTVPSTNGKTVNLDDPTNPLTTNAGFKTLLANSAFSDPEPTKYHYTYTSNGTDYTVSCVQTDTVDGTTVIDSFQVHDGESSTVPYAAPAVN